MLDFNGGAPPRDVRLKGNGWFAAVDTEECGRIADKLIGRVDQLDQYRLEGTAFDGLPRYFAHKRFFLASIDPPVLLVVPHTYRLKHPTASIKNPYSGTTSKATSIMWTVSKRPQGAEASLLTR